MLLDLEEQNNKKRAQTSEKAKRLSQELTTYNAGFVAKWGNFVDCCSDVVEETLIKLIELSKSINEKSHLLPAEILQRADEYEDMLNDLGKTLAIRRQHSIHSPTLIRLEKEKPQSRNSVKSGHQVQTTYLFLIQ
jgi:hypothetical protein